MSSLSGSFRRLPDGQITSAFRFARVQYRPQKYSASDVGQITFTTSPVLSPRGALRNVTDAGRDAVDADGAADESAEGGRRSRVVLTPRRWRQVLREDARDDGGKQARSPGRARRKPLKPLRGECRVFPGDLR
jgi:hypothetical protein